MNTDVRIFPYILRFAAVYLLLLIGLGLLLSLLQWESNAGTSIGALMAAAIAASYKFLHDHQRLPTDSERKKLVGLSLLAAWGVSLVLLTVHLSFSADPMPLEEMMNAMGLVIVLAVVAIVTLFYWMALALTYGYMARRQFEALVKKGKIQSVESDSDGASP